MEKIGTQTERINELPIPCAIGIKNYGIPPIEQARIDPKTSIVVGSGTLLGEKRPLISTLNE